MNHLFGLDLRSLALFRILLGLSLVWDLVSRLVTARDFYWGGSLAPPDVVTQHIVLSFIPSIHRMSPHLAFQIGLTGLHLALAICLTVGIRVSWVTPLCWYLTLSLHFSNEMVLNGGDYLTRNLLGIGCFLPWGYQWAWDTRKSKVNADVVANAATFALLLQLCLLYWTSAMLKTSPAWSKDYTAIFYALSLDNFATVPGLWLLRFPILLKFLTGVVYWTEWLAPVLILTGVGRLRNLGCALLIGLHLGISATLTVGLFWLVPIAMITAFLPSKLWSKVSVPSEDGRPNNLSTAASVLLYALAPLCIYLNLSSLTSLNWPVPRPLYTLMRTLGYHYGWGMFTGLDQQTDGLYLVVATLSDGSQRELLWGLDDIHQKPYPVSSVFPDHRWQRFVLNLEDERFAHHRDVVLNHCLKQWESQQSGPPIKELRLLYLEEATHLNYRDVEPVPRVLAQKSF